MENVELTFTDGALRELARLAIARGTGARGLRSIIESTMIDIMFDIPSRKDVASCLIDKNVILGKSKPILKKTEKNKSVA